MGGIQSEGHPAVGIQIGGVPLFLQRMDREGTLGSHAQRYLCMALALMTQMYATVGHFSNS